MPIIKEYKYKCDFCGIKSPSIYERSIDDPSDATSSQLPLGWILYNDNTRNSQESYSRWGARATIPRYFCCSQHLVDWQKEHESR